MKLVCYTGYVCQIITILRLDSNKYNTGIIPHRCYSNLILVDIVYIDICNNLYSTPHCQGCNKLTSWSYSKAGTLHLKKYDGAVKVAPHTQIICICTLDHKIKFLPEYDTGSQDNTKCFLKQRERLALACLIIFFWIWCMFSLFFFS